MTTVSACGSRSWRQSKISAIGTSLEPSNRERENSHGSRTSSRIGSSPRSSFSFSSRGLTFLWSGSCKSSFSLGLMFVVDDETAGGESFELLDHDAVVRVIQIRPQVVGGAQADKETVRIALGPSAEVLPNGEVHDVGDTALQVPNVREEVLDVLRRRVVVYREEHQMVYQVLLPGFCARLARELINRVHKSTKWPPEAPYLPLPPVAPLGLVILVVVYARVTAPH